MANIDDHWVNCCNLEPDPPIPTRKAIKIVTSEGHRVGYVPKDQTTYVRDCPLPAVATVISAQTTACIY